MLNLDDIIELYKEGVNVAIKNGRHPKGHKGVWELEERTVKIYLQSIESEDDKNITLIHEFLHAKDHLLLDRQSEEKRVEAESIETYKQNPKLAEFIKCLYQIN